MKERPISLVAGAIARLAEARDISSIKDFPGAVTMRVDQNWMVAANGHAEPCDVEPEGCMKVTLKPYEFAVWWNGWIAGVFNPYDGVFAAGEAANEARFLADVEKAIKGDAWAATAFMQGS